MKTYGSVKKNEHFKLDKLQNSVFLKKSIFLCFRGPKKQPRRCRVFTAYFGLNYENEVVVGRFPVLKVLNFFHRSISFHI